MNSQSNIQVKSHFHTFVSMIHDLACVKALINLLYHKENHPFNLLKTKKDNQINIGAKPISEAHKTEKRKPSRSFKARKHRHRYDIATQAIF